MYAKTLSNGFTIKEVLPSDLRLVLDEHFGKVYSNREEARAQWTIEESSKEKIKSREKSMQRYQLRLVVYFGTEVVGWHYGYATDAETYYMQNSAVLASFRNKGIYSQFLGAIMELLKEEGFQVVTSTHHPNNAAVLIPKLKKGFVISSMLIHEKFRLLVELKYFFNEERRKQFHQTIGLTL